jgi:hypothetical protein
MRGTAILATRLVETALARQFVPARVRIVPVLPRHTIAMLCMVRYEEGSALQYHELIVIPALVYAAGRIGAWVSHIYVDSLASLAGGRSIWGLPKEHAEFSWRRESVRVIDPDVRLQVVPSSPRAARARLPFLTPVFGATHPPFKWALGTGSGRIARVQGQVTISHPELRLLDFARVRTLFRIDDFRLTLPAPTLVGRRDGHVRR